MRWKWLAVLLPLGLGLAAAGLAVSGRLPNYLLYVRGDVATLSWLVGLLLSALAASYLFLGVRAEKNRRRDVAQVQARAADERRRFLRRLDHELKNPLTAIRAGLANLAWASSEEAQEEALGSVDAQALRLGRLAADLRKLAELETRSLERTSVNVADLLQEVLLVTQERPEGAERRLTLTVPQAPWPLPNIDGDQDLLFLAVHNLVDNALKFTAPGDTVEIRAFEDGATVVIEVADTGPGIPEGEIPHVWEELYRGQGARGVQGSGLGLALVQAIVERHGGQTSLRSRAGQGTVFTLRLPLQ
jgi:two-component system OmpR family sensor kinase